ncbi:MAG: hypothetical protein IT361_10355 [Gemmatimonadaceae bacterium]|nr:hypothetical protein [Gemmatimonadaceae bacterium]
MQSLHTGGTVTAPGVRRDVAPMLRQLGAGPAEESELLAYIEASDAREPVVDVESFPLADEPFVSAWRGYQKAAAEVGIEAALRLGPLRQLNFPVAAGMPEQPEYVAVTRRGSPVNHLRSRGVFHAPQRVQLLLHPTMAGHIPVIVAGDRRDFELLVRSVLHRNAPVEVPRSQGACMVAGFNNWDRVEAYRAAWSAEHPGATEADWTVEFARMAGRKALYQDRFMILSEGNYSAVEASAMAMDEEEWLKRSLTIRLEHECAHYLTRRVFNSMRNALLDELIADYAGLDAAFGAYRPEAFLRFMGLEAFPRYRSGGRLENYRGTPPLSDGAFRLLQPLVIQAARTLGAWSRKRPRMMDAKRDRAHMIVSLMQGGLAPLLVG